MPLWDGLADAPRLVWPVSSSDCSLQHREGRIRLRGRRVASSAAILLSVGVCMDCLLVPRQSPPRGEGVVACCRSPFSPYFGSHGEEEKNLGLAVNADADADLFELIAYRYPTVW